MALSFVIFFLSWEYYLPDLQSNHILKKYVIQNPSLMDQYALVLCECGLLLFGQWRLEIQTWYLVLMKNLLKPQDASTQIVHGKNM